MRRGHVAMKQKEDEVSQCLVWNLISEINQKDTQWTEWILLTKSSVN